MFISYNQGNENNSEFNNIKLVYNVNYVTNKPVDLQKDNKISLANNYISMMDRFINKLRAEKM